MALLVVGIVLAGREATARRRWLWTSLMVFGTVYSEAGILSRTRSVLRAGARDPRRQPPR